MQHGLISETVYRMKVSHKTVRIIWCHLYKILKQAKWLCGGKNQNKEQRMPLMGVRENWLGRWHNFLGMTLMFYNTIEEWVTQLYAFAKTQWMHPWDLCISFYIILTSKGKSVNKNWIYINNIYWSTWGKILISTIYLFLSNSLLSHAFCTVQWFLVYS